MIKQHQRKDSGGNPEENLVIQYLPEKPVHSPTEKLVRNLALAGMLILTVVSIHNAELPDGKTVQTAVQGLIDTPWDESLGKISFVSTLFPEAVSVFFSSHPDLQLLAPCSGFQSHSWNSQEPYLAYQSSDGKVYAAADGQVMSLAHGLNDERIIRIRHSDSIESLYYNLTNVAVAEGDFVSASTLLGYCMDNLTAVIDIRNHGKSVDPSAYIVPRDSESI